LADRDLASVELWETSLERSIRRRELAERQRRQAPKTKGTAAVVSAALFASPMLPVISAAGAHNRVDAAETSSPEKPTRVGVPTLLREGDTGRMVAAVQGKLAIDADGIFGPITRGAVLDFQARAGLSRTGEVDAKTWQSLFRASVSYVSGDSAIAERIVRDEPRSAPRLRVVDRQTQSEPPEASLPSRQAALENLVSVGREPDVTPASPAKQPANRPAVERPRVERPVAAPAPAPAPAPAAGCGTLASPVEGTVTSSFGEDRGDHRHAGQDISAPSGTPVRAVDCGTVTQAAGGGGYGNIVCVKHSATVSTCYAHLSSFETKRGDYVEVGQMIGRVGSTGNSTGPHLHFEVRENGSAVDPAPYLGGRARASGESAAQPSGTSESNPAAKRTRVSAAATGGSVGEGGVVQADLSEEAQSGRARLAAPEAEAVAVAVAEAAPAPMAEAPSAPAPVVPVVEAPLASAPTPAAPVAEAPVAEAPPAEAPPAPAPAAAEVAPVATPDPALVAETPDVPASEPVSEAPAVEAPVVAETPASEAPVVQTPAPVPAETEPEDENGGVEAPVTPAG